LISRPFWNLPTKATQVTVFLFSRAAKSFGIRQQKQLNVTVFCQPSSENFWNLPTNATKIGCIAANKNNSN
jgi:hypothetical protein